MTGEPHVVSGSFLDDTTPHRLQVQFDQDVSASLSKTDLYVSQAGSDVTRLSTSGFVMDGYDHTTDTATFHYNGIGNRGQFAEGRYSLKLYKSDIANTAGQGLASNWSMDFAFVDGDVNRDLTLNQDDVDYIANKLAVAPTGGLTNATRTDGDIDYDKDVDTDDYNAINDSSVFHGLPAVDQFATTLTVFDRPDGTRELHWVDDCTYELGYRIQVSTDGRTFTTLASQTPANVSSYIDAVTESDTPTYRIRAVLPSTLAAAHVSAYSVERTPTSGNGLPTPAGVATSGVGANHATVSWQSVSGADSYDVSLSRPGYPEKRVALVPSTTTTASLESLNAFQNYTVSIRAIGSSGTSMFGSASFTTAAGAPSLIADETGINANQLPFRFAMKFDQPVYEATPGALSALRAQLSDLHGDRAMNITSIAFDPADHSLIWITSDQAASSDYNYAGAWPEGFYQLLLQDGVLVNAAGQYPGVPIDPSDAGGDEVIARGVFVVADINGDGAVDSFDLAILTANYGASGVGYGGGDIDRNGVVDFGDLVNLSRRFGLNLAAPPVQPGDFTAQVPIDPAADTRHTIDLQWVAPSGATINGFDIFRSTNGTDFTKIARVAASAPSYRDANLWEGKRYYYRVRSFVTGADGSTTYSYTSPRSSAKTVLAMPTDLHVHEIETGRVWLEWNNAATTETLYRVERTTTPSDEDSWSAVGTGLFAADATWAEDSDVQPGIRYFYRVSALNNQTESATALTHFQSDLPTPDSFSALTVSQSQVVLSWSLPTTDESTIDGFYVERSLDGINYAQVASLQAGARSYTDVSTLPADATATYRILSHHVDQGFIDRGGYTEPVLGGGARMLDVDVQAPATIAEGDTLALDLSVLNSDDGLTPDQWIIDWGDGSDLDDDGVIGSAVNGDSRSTTHLYADNGSYTITATAPFADIVTRQKSVNVAVTNVAPTLTVTGDDTALPDQPYQVTLNAADPGADTVSQWQVNWGDGSATQIIDGAATFAEHTYTDQVDSAAIHVTAIDEDGSYTAAALDVSIDPLAPEPISFDIISPTAVTINWSPRSARATGYLVELAPDSAFDSDMQQWSVGAGVTTFDLTNLAPDTAYSVRVGSKHGATTHFDINAIGFATPAVLAAAPTDLAIDAGAGSAITLNWTASESSRYAIERSTDNGSSWTTLSTTALGAAAFADDDIAEGQSLRYRVRASNGIQTSSPSNVVTYVAPVTAPDNVTATPLDTSSIRLDWSDLSNAEIGYRVERSDSADGAYTLVADLNANEATYTVGNLAANHLYYFGVSSKNAANAFSPGVIASAATLPSGIIPDAPTLAAANLSNLPGSVGLSWTAAPNATDYRIERSTDESSWSPLNVFPVSSTAWTDTTIAGGNTYFYRVIAVNAGVGESEPSNLITATTSLAAATNLVALTVGDTSADLSFTDNATNEEFFTLWRFDQATGGVGTNIGTIPASSAATSVNYTLALSDTQTHWYSVTADTRDAESAFSNRVSIAAVTRRVDFTTDDNTIASGSEATFDFESTGFNQSLTWSVNWGDGSPLETITSPSGSSILDRPHAFPTVADGENAVEYHVQATAVSADGTVYESPTQILSISASSSTQSSDVELRRQILEKFNEIYNTIEYQPYLGILKGADATRDTKSGNDWDQALLLQQEINNLATKAGRGNQIHAKLRMDVVRAGWDDLRALLGVGDAKLTAATLRNVGLMASGSGNSRAFQSPQEVVNADTTSTADFWHVRVEVTGMSPGDVNAKLILDPSWKYHELRSGNPLFTVVGGNVDPVVGDNANTQFDPAEYVKQQTFANPVEWFEDRLTNTLYGSSSGNLNLRGRLSLADAAFAGPIQPRNFITESVRNGGYTTIATSGSGYDVLTAGNQAFDTPEQAELNPNDGAGSYQPYQQLRLRVLKLGHTDSLVEHTWNLADVSTKSLGVRYDELDQDDGDVKAVIYAGADAHTASGTLSRNDQVLIKVGFVKAGSTVVDERELLNPPTGLQQSYAAGRPIGIMLATTQYSSASVAAHDRALSDAADAILSDGSISTDDQAAINTYQTELLGALAARYAQQSDSQSRRFADLGGFRVDPTPGWGYVTGVDLHNNVASVTATRRDLLSALTLTDPANKSALGFNLVGTVYGLWSRFTALDNNAPASHSIQAAVMFGRSELESSVLEEMLGSEAMSTAKGLRIVESQSSAVGVKHISTAADVGTWEDTFVATDKTGNNRDAWNMMDQRLKSLFAGAATTEVWAPLALPHIVANEQHPFAVWLELPKTISPNTYAGALISDGTSTFGGRSLSVNYTPPEAPLKDNSQRNRSVTGDPVQQSTGVLYQDENIVSLPTPGLPLALSLHYDTRFKEEELAYNRTDGDLNWRFDVGFGLGWSTNFSDRLHLSSDKKTLTWISAAGDAAELTGISDSWNLPAGKFGTLVTQHPSTSATTISGFLYTALDHNTMEFDKDGRLIHITDAAGDTITLTYQVRKGAEAVLATATYAMRDSSDPRTLTFTADGTGRHIQTIGDDDGRTWTVEMTPAGARTYLKSWRLATDKNTTGSTPSSIGTQGGRYDNVYDYFTGSLRGGLLKTITRKIDTGIVGTQSYAYYANGRTLSTTNSLGATEYFSYDTFVSSALNFGIARPSVGTTRAYHTDFNGNVTTTLFDRFGNPVTVENPDGSRQTSTWIQYRSTLDLNSDDDGRWLPASQTDEDGLSTLYVYPTKTVGGKLLVKSAANGLPSKVITNSSANPAAAVTTSTDGLTTTYQYDATFGDKPTIINVGGRKTQNYYDGTTGAITKTDVDFSSLGTDGKDHGLTATTKYFYLSTTAGQTLLLDYVLQPGGKKINYIYDAAKQLRTRVDQDHRLGEFSIYDKRGDLKESFTYDPALYVSESDAKSHAHEHKQFVYDSLDRLRETWVDFDKSGTFSSSNTAERVSKIDYGAQPVSGAGGRVQLTKTTTTFGATASGAFGAANSVEFLVYNAQDQVVTSKLDGLAETATENVYDGQGNLVWTSQSRVTPRVSRLLIDSRGRTRATLASDGGLSWQVFDGAGRVIESDTAFGKDAASTDVSMSAAKTTSLYFSSAGGAGRVQAVLGADNTWTKFDYDSFGEVTTQKTYTTGDSPIDSHLFEKVINRYDALGRVIDSRSSHGGTVSTSYDLNGNAFVTTAYDDSGFNNFMSMGLDAFPARAQRQTATLFDDRQRPYATRDAAGYVSLTEYNASGEVSATDDPRATSGAFTLSSFLTHSNAASFRTAAGAYQTRHEYDEAGRETKTVLPDADTDTNNNLHESTDYYPDGRTRSHTDAAGNTTKYQYSDVNYALAPTSTSRVKVTDSFGGTTTTDSNLFGQVVASTDVRGAVTTTQYDSMGRPITVKGSGALNVADGDAAIVQNTYDIAGRLTESADDTITHATHRARAAYTYDDAGQLIKTELFDRDAGSSSNTAISTSSHTYNNGLVVTSENSRNKVTSYIHKFSIDGKHTVATRVASVDVSSQTTNSLGEVVEDSLYDSNSRRWRITQYKRDLMGRLMETRAPDADTSDTLPADMITGTVYDQVGNAIGELSADAEAWLRASSSNSVGVAMDKHIGTTTTQYDAMNRVTKIVEADSKRTVNTDGSYNATGYQLTDSPTTSYGYSISSTSTGAGGLFVVTQTDPAGNATITQSDAAGRPVNEQTTVFLSATTPTALATRAYSYAADGYWSKLVDRNGHVIQTNVDRLGRVTSESWKPSSTGSTVATIAYKYDHLGHLLAAKTTAGSGAVDLSTNLDFTYTYDALGNAVIYIEGGGTLANVSGINANRPTVAHTIGYDRDSNVISDLTKYSFTTGGLPIDSTINYSYSDQGFVNKLEQTVNSYPKLSKTFTYDSNSLGEASSVGRTLTSQLTVKADGKLYRAIHRDAAGQITGTGAVWRDAALDLYQYDRNGRVKQWNSTVGDMSAGYVKDTRSIAYDSLGRLKTVDSTFQTPTPDEGFTYDLNGNRVLASKDLDDVASAMGKDNRVRSDDLYDYTYDLEGNLLTRVAKNTAEAQAAGAADASYTYDYRNRLTLVDTSNRLTQFAYDAAGRRVLKRSRPKGGASNPWSTTLYGYGNALGGGGSASDHPSLVFTADDATHISTHLAERYLYGPGESGNGGQAEIEAVDDLALRVTTWFHQDQIGSIRRTSQNLTERSYQEFDTYGNLIGSAQGINDGIPPQLVDEFNTGIGVRLGSAAATAGNSAGLHWTISGNSGASVSSAELPNWVIGKNGRARPMAGGATPQAADASDVHGAGRALVDTGERDGAISATLTDDRDTTAGSSPNSSASITGFAIGLSARGGTVNLFAELPGSESPPAGIPNDGKARKLRLTDASGHTIVFAGGVSVWARNVRDKITLALNGTTATVFVNDVQRATATVATAKQAASAATTWGLVYKTSTPITGGQLLDAWDSIRFKAPITLTRFAYAGAEFDPETGLYHMGARDYDPSTGRFLQQDPAGEGTNLYEYANSDPIDFNDPTGMFSFRAAGAALGSPFGGFGAALGGAIGGTIDDWREPAASVTTAYSGSIQKFSFNKSFTGYGGGYGSSSSNLSAMAIGRSTIFDPPPMNKLDYIESFGDSLASDIGAGAEQWGRDMRGGAKNMWRDAGGTWDSLIQQNGEAMAQKILVANKQGRSWSDAQWEVTSLSSAVRDGTGSMNLAEAYDSRDYFGDLSGQQVAQRYLTGTSQALGTVTGAVSLGRGMVSATRQLGPSQLTRINNSIEIGANRAFARAFNRGLQGAEVGNMVDRYMSKVAYKLDRAVTAGGAELRVLPQFGRNAFNENIQKLGRMLQKGDGFLDIAVTDAAQKRVLSAWDFTVSARWNDARTVAKYMRMFKPEEGYVREMNAVVNRPNPK